MGPLFVYQCRLDGTESLYRSGLNQQDADEDMKTLDRLIESGCCGDGCAVQGSLECEEDFHVAKRLGLIDESVATYEDFRQGSKHTARTNINHSGKLQN